MNPTYLSGVSQILDNYDIFLIDLWGVIHDGESLYDTAEKSLSYLKKNQKKIIFISNAPRRSRKAALSLHKMGIAEKYYDYIITSGEMVFLNCRQNQDKYGKHYFIIGPERDDDLISEITHYQRVTSPETADFIIITGYDNDDSTANENVEYLNIAKSRGLKIICANPDKIIVRKSGKKVLCAGVMADYYTNIGGIVEYFGKPYYQIYDHIKNIFNIQNTKRLLAIGDNPDTDIAGANLAGIDNILITDGILSTALALENQQVSETKIAGDSDNFNIILNEIITNKTTSPNYICKKFLI